MAKTVITETTDDLDGSANATTVAFSFGGAALEIDLSKRNKAAFDRIMAPYVAAARKSSRSRTTGTTRAKRSKSASDLGAIRAWAAQNGYSVSDRGRIPLAVSSAFDAAH